MIHIFINWKDGSLEPSNKHLRSTLLFVFSEWFTAGRCTGAARLLRFCQLGSLSLLSCVGLEQRKALCQWAPLTEQDYAPCEAPAGLVTQTPLETTAWWATEDVGDIQRCHKGFPHVSHLICFHECDWERYGHPDLRYSLPEKSLVLIFFKCQEESGKFCRVCTVCPQVHVWGPGDNGCGFAERAGAAVPTTSGFGKAGESCGR